MNKGNPGFTLLELLIATMIASILGMLLFAAFFQINRFVPVIDARTQIIEKAALVNDQLEKDLAGVIAPPEFYARQPREKQDQKKPEQKEEPEGKDEKKKKPLEKLFYGVNKGGMLDQLTFITTSSLQVYWGPKSGSAKPRMVRVLYTLKEEPNKTKDGKKSYSLVRTESPRLDFDAIRENSSEYVLATGIKSLTVDYTAIMIEPERKGAPGQKTEEKKEEKKEPEVVQVDEWGRAKKEEPQKKDEKQLPLVPAIAAFEINFWDQAKKRSMAFPFTIAIPANLPLKKANEQIAERMLGTLKDLFGQSVQQNSQKQQPPTQLAQRTQPRFNFEGRR